MDIEKLKGVLSDSGINVINKEETGNRSKGVEGSKVLDVKVSKADVDMMISLGLIPQAYRDVEFNVDIIKENIIQQVNNSSRKFKVRRFQEYIDTLNGLLGLIAEGKRPNASYIIGSPNGFGKTSFVNTCIKYMYKNGMKCVPYISLYELAEIKAENDRNIVRAIKLYSNNESDDIRSYELADGSSVVKVPKVITGCYSWSEYINADILFCYLTTVDMRIIESYTLKAVLDTRGTKGLPTIVFTSTSLEPYKKDYSLREYVWDEILEYNPNRASYDRLKHISCYKVYDNITEI
ncbi:MAG: hypothetical protein QXD03_02600 [Candidatus Anstonellales archaeon]